MEGADNDCGRPLCCRTDSGPAPTEARKAGKWGDFLCDLNPITLKSLFSFINDDVKPDVILWGGDSIPHNLDSLTEEDNIRIMKKITTDIKNSFPDTRIYPTIGNHDTYP
jgi:sphingomyelin phosphodiesterase